MDRAHRVLFKNKADFGDLKQNRNAKRKSVFQGQKNRRDESFFARRNVKETTPPDPQPEPKDPRREKLLKWKAAKEARLRELKKIEAKKPPFKAGIVHHSEDPWKNLPPVPASTFKSDTLKKAASAARADAAAKRKDQKPSTAAASLHHLSTQVPCEPPQFTGRVTRARAAAAAGAAPKSTKSGVLRGAGAAPKAVKSVVVKGRFSPKRAAKSRQPTETFAPKDYKFKGPANLTFPTTPQTLKRKSKLIKSGVSTDWPIISGVSRLGATPKAHTPRKSSRLHKELPKFTISAKSPEEHMPVEVLSAKDNCVQEVIATCKVTVSAKSPEQHNLVEVSPAKDDCIQEVEMTDATPLPVLEERNQSVSGVEEIQSSMNVEAAEDVDTRPSRMSIHEPLPPVEVTPDKLATGMVPAQFSPYITSARGKERHASRRRSSIALNISLSAEEHRKANQVEHFRCLLENETGRLLQQCDVWDEIRESAPSTAQDLILGAVGQARLLSKDKFQQFKRLIDKFESGEAEEKMTADDLFGFWEMMQLTVKNVNGRFEKLHDLKCNNWEERMPEFPIEKKPGVTNAAPKPRKKVCNAKSRLREVIEAARKRKEELNLDKSANQSCKSVDGGFSELENQSKSELRLVTTPKTRAVTNPTPKSVTRVSLARTRKMEADQADTKSREEAAELQKASSLSRKTFDGGFFKVDSPSKSDLKTASPRTPNRCLGAPTTPGHVPRRSLLQHVLTNSAARTHSTSAVTLLQSSASPPRTLCSPTIKGVAAQLRASLLGRRMSMSSPVDMDNSVPEVTSVSKPTPAKGILKSGQTVCASGSIQRNRVLFELSGGISSPLRQLTLDEEYNENVTPMGQKRVSKRFSLNTKQGDRPSLLPVRKSISASKPLPGGDLISWDSPTEGRVLRSRASNVQSHQ